MFEIGVKRTSVAAIGAIALAVVAHAQSAIDWSAAAGDLGATKYAPVDQITPANVTKLTQAWTYQPAGPSPIVISNIMYFVAAGTVVALNADSGTEAWTFKLSDATPGGVIRRGMTYWAGTAQHAPRVLVTISSGFFRGEEEREMGFRSAMRTDQPHRSLVEISEGGGLDAPMHELVLDALERDPGIIAVYSCGGGNVATVESFDELRRAYAVFIAHDLDEDNTRLLRDGRLSAVLHHDLNQDMRRACHIIMKAHGALPGAIQSVPSSIQVVTPYNMPSLGMRAAFGRRDATADA